MINFDNYANENKTSHNQRPYIPDHPKRIHQEQQMHY